MVRSLSVCLLSIVLLISCRKVNEATELGGDLIPAVDNVNTFDTTLEILSYNFPFTTEDSSRSSSSELQFVGKINNDLLFGRTTATLFLQLKPERLLRPFAFTSRDSLIGLDSAVMVLSYRTVYGDSTANQQLQVFEIAQNNKFTVDSFYLIHRNDFTYNNALSGIRTVLPSTLNDPVTLFRERGINQLRIRLNDDFGRRLLNYDSTNAYRSDSAFNTFVKGFAVAPQGNGAANALIGVSLPDTNTKLAIYYRYVRNGVPDTAVTYFRFTPRSASANYIQREYQGSEFASVAGDNTADQLVYIQNAPGTFARLVVPGLTGLTNRVVHRAELTVQQVPDQQSNIFTTPTYLYLDAFDVQDQVYRTIPFDVILGGNGQLNVGTFGMIARIGADPTGRPIAVWRFDVSRYVQRVANGTNRPFEFRLYSPFITRSNIGLSTSAQTLFVNPNFAVGRVRVGGGNHPTQPMRLRIIYSKI